MSIKSNLYAEKIFSEHPIGLWSLDDDVDYLSLISESQRNILNWNFTGATVTSPTISLKQPFNNSVLNKIEFDDFATPDKEIKFVGPDLKDLNELSFELATITKGIYFYSDSAYLKSISVGFEYTDTSSAEIVEKVKIYDSFNPNSWNFISHTSEFPNQDTSFRPILKIKFDGGAILTDSYVLYINGMSIGQCSENFNTTSLGKQTVSFPSEISLSGINSCIPANAYAVGSKNGYYILDNNFICAKNTSVPMVYGSDSITKILPNQNNPSFIIPGLGFLNNIGRYKEYTFEMWLRINSDTEDYFRIFGPIGSSDGLYVEDGFITLVIGNKFKSHHIGEWYRPMLLQIRLSSSNASLLINGEQVVSIDIDMSSIELPSEFDETGKEQDWLGFYGDSDVSEYEIDCIAIYSYLVPDILAKKRFVYGQGVISPENINSAYGAKTAFFDYAFSEYTANYEYPNIGKWNQAKTDNMFTDSKTLSVSEYSLPNFFLDNFTYEKLINDLKEVQTSERKYFSFRPNSDWENKKTYAYFNNFSILSDSIHGIAMTFKINSFEENPQTLFSIENYVNGNYFKINLEDDIIKYIFSYNGNVSVVKQIENVQLDTYMPVGFNIGKLSKSFGLNLETFFGSKNNLRIYIGANANGEYNFLGNIYSFDIFSNYNISIIDSYFDDDGICIIENGENFIDHIATYTLFAELKHNNYYIDIASAGYWEDYIPLSYFGSYVSDIDGNQYYNIDFLQFNIDYPSPTKIYFGENTLPEPYLANGAPNPARGDEWDYEDIDTEYDHPTQKSYAQFDNSLFTNWQDYEDLSEKAIKTYFYNTDTAFVKSYISIQYIKSGANKNFKSFTNISALNNNKILDLSTSNAWINTVFEVVDNTIIYPPKNVDFNDLAIVTHLVFDVKGTTTKNIKIRKLELASQVYNHNSATKIGTRFGIPAYPYKKSGIYYDYNSKNPISITKETVPYLYTTKKSGIEIRGTFSPFISRGVAIPINSSLSNNYSVSAMQTWLKYNFDKFPYGSTQVFELEHKYDTIQFFVSAVTEVGDRGKLFAINKSTGDEVSGIAFYINGNITREPILEAKQWQVIGVSFANSINLDNSIGSLNLVGPFVFNSVTTYQSTALQEIQSKIYRKWLRVKNDGDNDIFWSYWLNSFIWNEVLVLSTAELYGVDPSTVYNAYIGRNKFIVEPNTSEGIIFTADSMKIFTNTLWQSDIQTPV